MSTKCYFSAENAGLTLKAAIPCNSSGETKVTKQEVLVNSQYPADRDRALGGGHSVVQPRPNTTTTALPCVDAPSLLETDCLELLCLLPLHVPLWALQG